MPILLPLCFSFVLFHGSVVFADYRGSVSAEHGIGIDKIRWLAQCRSPEEIELMRTMKKSLDPGNLLNPGRIFEEPITD